jgi:hypothetical protein
VLPCQVLSPQQLLLCSSGLEMVCCGDEVGALLGVAMKAGWQCNVDDESSHC